MNTSYKIVISAKIPCHNSSNYQTSKISSINSFRYMLSSICLLSFWIFYLLTISFIISTSQKGKHKEPIDVNDIPNSTIMTTSRRKTRSSTCQVVVSPEVSLFKYFGYSYDIINMYSLLLLRQKEDIASPSKPKRKKMILEEE